CLEQERALGLRYDALGLRYDVHALLQNRHLFQIIYPGYLWARDKRWFLSRVQRLAGPAGGQGPFVPVEPPTRTKGPPFVPVGGSTRDKRSNLFSPGWWLHPGQKGDPFIPVGGTNRDKRTLNVIVQKRVILY